MPAGRESKALDKRHIERLKEFQRRMYLSGRGGSVPQLKLAMTGAPFKWGVLQRALRGNPIGILNYEFIRDWLDRNVPDHVDAEVFDSKRASSGDREDEIAQGRARLRSE